MNTFLLRAGVAVLLALGMAAVPALAGAPTSQHALGFGVRSHALHSVFEEYPFDDGDLSYGIAYEYHESGAYWQLALDYGFDANRTNTVDQVFTPQLNLIFKDSIWRGGLGVLGSYIMYDTDDSEVEDDWTDVYYQFLLGIGVPLGSMAIDVMAAYPFADWGDLGDFDAGDIEVQAWIKFLF